MDAFCLSSDLADPKHTSRICPVTQPDYTGLRLEDAVLQHDILNHVDLHKSQPAEFNPRLADLGSKDSVTGKHVIRENRIGRPQIVTLNLQSKKFLTKFRNLSTLESSPILSSRKTSDRLLCATRKQWR
jgi:hypothetical protein